MLIYVPLVYRLNVDAGIPLCSAQVTHFIIAESMSIQWQINGLALMIIWATAAMLVQLWMPSTQANLLEGIDRVESQMRQALEYMSDYLEDSQGDIGAIRQKLKQIDDSLKQLQEQALTDYGNQFIQRNDYCVQYSQMRLNQVHILQQMLLPLQNIHLQTEQNTVLARLYYQTAEEFDEQNTGAALLADISALYRYFQDTVLPKSRQEFESRALLYQLLIQFEHFLQEKYDFFIQHPSKRHNPTNAKNHAA